MRSSLEKPDSPTKYHTHHKNPDHKRHSNASPERSYQSPIRSSRIFEEMKFAHPSEQHKVSGKFKSAHKRRHPAAHAHHQRKPKTRISPFVRLVSHWLVALLSDSV
jgi:hypothetical protein